MKKEGAGMTREEAINIIETVRNNTLDYKLDKALYMTIPSVNSQTPSGDLISRQEVLDGIEELKKSPWATDKRGNGFEYLITEALEVVADLCVKQSPSVNPQEPKTGHWIKNAPEYQNIDPPYICSECGHSNLIKTNYCEQCGAKMVEPQESEDKE